MLYHYFGDKEDLFQAVLRRKIAERQAWAESLSGDPAESLPFWFEAACKDTDWVRMLEWEALAGRGQKVIDAKQRRAATARGLERIRQRQARGQISSRLRPAPCDAGHAVADDVSGGVPAIDAAHHGPAGFRSEIPEGTRGVFEKIRGGVSTDAAAAVKIHFVEIIERMKKFFRFLISTFATALAAVFWPAAVRAATTKARGAGVPVLVAQAVATNLPVRIDPPPVGHVMPVSTVTIHSQIGGIISEVHFKEGQEVKQRRSAVHD